MTDIVLRMKALPDLTNEKAWEVVYEGAREIERLRTALEKIRDSRQLGRLGFVEPIEVYIPRIKEIAGAALQQL